MSNRTVIRLIGWIVFAVGYVLVSWGTGFGPGYGPDFWHTAAFLFGVMAISMSGYISHDAVDAE